MSQESESSKQRPLTVGQVLDYLSSFDDGTPIHLELVSGGVKVTFDAHNGDDGDEIVVSL